jgi:hypothetical protein
MWRVNIPYRFLEVESFSVEISQVENLPVKSVSVKTISSITKKHPQTKFVD